jgi:hypothetical protein
MVVALSISSCQRYHRRTYLPHTLQGVLGHPIGAPCRRRKVSMRHRTPEHQHAWAGERARVRWSSRRKLEVVLRVLRGEALDALFRELEVTSGASAVVARVRHLATVLGVIPNCLASDRVNAFAAWSSARIRGVVRAQP